MHSLFHLCDRAGVTMLRTRRPILDERTVPQKKFRTNSFFQHLCMCLTARLVATDLPTKHSYNAGYRLVKKHQGTKECAVL